MQPVEIIAVILAAGIVLFTVIFNIAKRKKGKSCCGCDCGCTDCGGKCPSGKLKNKN